MKRFLLFTLLTLFSLGAFAQTGVYYDRTVVGEGVTVFEHTGIGGVPWRTFWLYTYGDEECEIVTEMVDHNISATAEATAICPNSVFWPHNPLCDPVVETVVVNQIVQLPHLSKECDLDGQRWFVGSDPVLLDNGDSVGELYMTHGQDYPTCVPSLEPFEEDVDICDEVIPMGKYLMRVGETGYQLWVQAPNKLSTDPLYNHAFNFDTLLVDPSEPEAGPK